MTGFIGIPELLAAGYGPRLARRVLLEAGADKIREPFTDHRALAWRFLVRSIRKQAEQLPAETLRKNAALLAQELAAKAIADFQASDLSKLNAAAA